MVNQRGRARIEMIAQFAPNQLQLVAFISDLDTMRQPGAGHRAEVLKDAEIAVSLRFAALLDFAPASLIEMGGLLQRDRTLRRGGLKGDLIDAERRGAARYGFDLNSAWRLAGPQVHGQFDAS